MEPGVDISDWARRLAVELDRLGRSITGVRYKVPTLSTAGYHALAQAAEHDPQAREAFDFFLPELNSDPSDAVQVLGEHPTVRRALEGSRGDDAIMMTMPGRAFRVELKRLALYLTKATVRGGSWYAASTIERYLALNDENRLPGHEVTLLSGLEVQHRFDLGEGVYIAPYEEVVDLGLAKEPADVPWEEDAPDYRGMGAAALVRDFTWGPGVRPAMTSATPRSEMDVEIAFPCLSNLENLGIAIDVISLVTRCRMQLLTSELRGATFMEDIDPSFHHGARTWFTSPTSPHHQRRNTKLSEDEASEIEEVLGYWMKPHEIKEHVVRRLASAVTRSGRFGSQDGVLDLSIALESMYRLDNELKYKLATRAGYFLGPDAEDRTRIFKAVGRFYRVRSDIVHGRNTGHDEAKEALEDGFEVARDTFLKLLRGGGIRDWDSLVMGGTESSAADGNSE